MGSCSWVSKFTGPRIKAREGTKQWEKGVGGQERGKGRRGKEGGGGREGGREDTHPSRERRKERRDQNVWII